MVEGPKDKRESKTENQKNKGSNSGKCMTSRSDM